VGASGYTADEIKEVERLGARVVGFEDRLFVSEARNRIAEAATGDLLLFLDDDNELDEHAASRLASALEDSSRIAVAGALTYYGDERDRIWCAGVEQDRLLGLWKQRTTLPDPVPELLPTFVYHNCFMVRRADFQAVGGFAQDQLPMLHAEPDVILRIAQLSGGAVVCVTGARSWHYISPNLARNLHVYDPTLAYHTARARSIFVAKHGGRLGWVAHLAVRQWALAGFYLLVALTSGPAGKRMAVAKEYLRGVSDGMRQAWSIRRHGRPRLR